MLRLLSQFRLHLPPKLLFLGVSLYCTIAAFSEVPDTESLSNPLQDTGESATELWLAVFDKNRARLESILSQGASPDMPLEEADRLILDDYFRAADLSYYFNKEKGFRPLMLAASLGEEALVETLLAAGADPWLKTKKHRSFALQFAARNGHLGVMRRLLKVTPDSEAYRRWIHIDLQKQRAILGRDQLVLLEAPISSGRATHPTPRGKFLVTDKYKNWKSTIYRVNMPWFLRLSCGEVGLHEGRLPGYPASHGCIRLPKEKARVFYELVPIGTLVVIE